VIRNIIGDFFPIQIRAEGALVDAKFLGRCGMGVQAAAEPISSQVRNLFERTGLCKEVCRTGHDFQLLVATKFRNVPLPDSRMTRATN
jgi:hypothetical protein